MTPKLPSSNKLLHVKAQALKTNIWIFQVARLTVTFRIVSLFNIALHFLTTCLLWHGGSSDACDGADLWGHRVHMWNMEKNKLLRKESAANRLELCGPSECLSGCNFGFQGKLRVQLCLRFYFLMLQLPSAFCWIKMFVPTSVKLHLYWRHGNEKRRELKWKTKRSFCVLCRSVVTVLPFMYYTFPAMSKT